MFSAGLFDDAFVDEHAYISQSFYSDLFFSGQRDHPDWLDFFAFDLQTLPKYFIGVGLRATSMRMPTPRNAVKWYFEGYTPFGDRSTLLVARVPFVVTGVVGCVALFACGALIGGRTLGTIAALLLMLNPLFRLHAHRAMSEVPYEAFLIAALAVALGAIGRIWSGRGVWSGIVLLGVAGFSSGLSIACKFNGFLAVIVILAWCGAGLFAPRLSGRGKLALGTGALAMMATAGSTFIALNPALTAHPRGPLTNHFARADEGIATRFQHMIDYRLSTSRSQQQAFPKDALHSPVERAKVFAVQGFGRFGPFGPSRSDSTVRYQVKQDWGLVFWWPLVVLGLIRTYRLGRSQLRDGSTPTAFALLIWAALSWVVVASYLPMAWDRYLLPVQAPNALLAGVALSGLWARRRDRILAAWRRVDAPAVGVFVILFGSYAFFWHSRDWNTASRLMLTYSLVDRGTVAIDGLDRGTGDKAFFRGHYYSDKLPGYPFLAALPYAYAKWALDLTPHPLDSLDPIAHWQSDYWITLGTSGLLTAGTAVLLVLMARELGCSTGASVLVGLAYGLATPAYVYATLAYGHQASAFALLGSFFLIWKGTARDGKLRMFLAGFLAAYAAVIELQVGPVSAILGLYLLTEVLRGRRPPSGLGMFALGAALPSLFLLAYNDVAFGSPWEMGYFHHATREFALVHNRRNPLGLQPPDWSRLGPLLWGGYRGLFFYAPILLLAIPGWAALVAGRRRDVAAVSMLVVAAVLLVNLSYPEWTGGWSTGPRLLVPLIPFAMLAVAGLLAVRSPSGRIRIASTFLAAGLALAGGIVMLLFQGADARIPAELGDPISGRSVALADPLRDAVWPIWTGDDPSPPWRFGARFCRNLVSETFPEAVRKLAPRWQPIQFLPLVLAQGLGVVLLWRLCRGVAVER